MTRGVRKGADSGGNVTADRAFELLLLFSDERTVISAAEAAQELSTSRSTTYRYLDSLRSYGFLADDPAGNGFRLGPAVLELARVARRGFGLSEIALPLMRDLACRLHETVLLTRRFGDRVVAIEREEEPGARIRISYERGQVLPLHAGASAKVLLAFAPDEEIDALLGSIELQRFTASTVVDPAQFRRQLERIRADGHAVSRGELDEGVVGVAAPIFAPDGSVHAGLSAVGLAFRLPDETLASVVAEVRRTAAAITASYAALAQ